MKEKEELLTLHDINIIYIFIHLLSKFIKN